MQQIKSEYEFEKDAPWYSAAVTWAEENNLMVDFPLGSAFIPDYVLATDPEATAIWGKFLPYTLDNKTVRTVLDLFAQLMAPIVNESKAINSILLTNEPAVWANGGDYYLPKWHQYLKDRYGTVLSMSVAHGTWYSSFDEIGWPKRSDGALSHDYIRFNDGLLAEFHDYLAKTIKEAIQ